MKVLNALCQELTSNVIAHINNIFDIEIKNSPTDNFDE